MHLFRGADALPHQTEADALYGAACREVWLRYNLESCTTQDERDKLAVIVRNIFQWAQSQPNNIKQAYQRACSKISSEADKYLENATRKRHMMELHRNLPKPPK